MRKLLTRLKPIHWYVISGILAFTTVATLAFYQNQNSHLQTQLKNTGKQEKDTYSQLIATKKELDELKNQDQVKINQTNIQEINNINRTYKASLAYYARINDLRVQKVKIDKMDELLAKAINLLANKDYKSADNTFTELNKLIKTEEDKIAATITNANGGVNIANIPVNNAPPGSGYSRQSVNADIGTYVVDIVAADMGSTKVIVDTAASGDCHDNCPVLPLSDYVSRNGAFAGVNGSYFCPAAYPQCAGKTNTFDTLLMNKNKVYFNSDNNVYSTVPAVIFLSGSMRFVGQSLDWGRDTSPDGVLANQPLVLSGGNIAFGGDGDPKKGSKGNRSFVGNKGSTAYIGVVHNATVAEVGHVLKALGLDNGLNLDSGGSIALFANGGYKAGPGRAIPNAILFVRK